MNKSKFCKILIFIIVSTASFSTNIVNGKTIVESVKLDNNENVSGSDLLYEHLNIPIEETNNEKLIYLEDIIETESEKQTEKITKLEKLINKIDEKINPPLSFKIASSYGNWYLIKTDNIQDQKLENIRYNFKQEENGYRIEKNFFNPNTNKWDKVSQRGWIEEKKGKVYLGIEKKWFYAYENEILFFDKNYQYMIIKYSEEGVVRVFAKKPGPVTLVGTEKEEFENILQYNKNLKDIVFNVKNEIGNIEKAKEEKEIEERAKKIEEQIKKDPSVLFKIEK